MREVTIQFILRHAVSKTKSRIRSQILFRPISVESRKTIYQCRNQFISVRHVYVSFNPDLRIMDIYSACVKIKKNKNIPADPILSAALLRGKIPAILIFFT